MKKSLAPRGYTLIELVITMSIVALTLLFSAPSIADWAPYYRMKGDASTLAGILTTARFESVKRNQNVVVSFNTATEAITVFQDTDKDGTQDAGEATLSNYTLSQSVDFGVQGMVSDDLNNSGNPPTGSITFTNNRVSFASNGSATPAGEIYLMFDTATTVNEQHAFGISVAASGQVKYARWNQVSSNWD